ncbi:Mediator of RNA polymerase II transcription subunit 10 [Phlyctochytrium planicorne]|nr:Mediator of RNA polymerase II transcription subunit 10 [Phlyctochytrium planicorne]
MADVEKKVQGLVNHLFRIGVTVYDFQPGSAPILHRRINDLASQMVALDAAKEDLNDVRVPFSLIDFIEEGKNPDIYTKDLIQLLIDKNQKTNGRIQTMKMFRNDLERELLSTFPDVLSLVNNNPSEPNSSQS